MSQSTMQLLEFRSQLEVRYLRVYLLQSRPLDVPYMNTRNHSFAQLMLFLVKSEYNLWTAGITTTNRQVRSGVEVNIAQHSTDDQQQA